MNIIQGRSSLLDIRLTVEWMVTHAKLTTWTARILHEYSIEDQIDDME